MNPPDQPLSKEVLLGALTSALGEPHPAPYCRILLNEERWRAVVESQDIQFMRGLPVELIHPDDLNLTMKNVFVSNYGFGDYSAYLIPEPHYDQGLMLELDFRYATTHQVEALLRSGEITVTPCDGDYQYWYTATVVKDEGHRKLEDLICPQDYHGQWDLRGDVCINVQDGDITIVSAKHTASEVEREIVPLLVRRYGVKVNTARLRKRAARLLDQAIKQEARANYFRQLHQLSLDSETNAKRIRATD